MNETDAAQWMTQELRSASQLELRRVEPEAVALEVGGDRGHARRPGVSRPHQLRHGVAHPGSRRVLALGADEDVDRPLVALEQARQDLASEEPGRAAQDDARPWLESLASPHPFMEARSV